MKKILENYLWSEICDPSDKEAWNSDRYRSPRDVIKEMVARKWINSPKQAHATLDKWIRKGIYEYGTSLDLGWKCKPRNKEEEKDIPK